MQTLQSERETQENVHRVGVDVMLGSASNALPIEGSDHYSVKTLSIRFSPESEPTVHSTHAFHVFLYIISLQTSYNENECHLSLEFHFLRALDCLSFAVSLSADEPIEAHINLNYI